ncbi:hypothetical protein [Algoriphagus sp. A40]|uniref:hypothetical protein n=1 Tax=Algoriphagus sp. A40 TaxID=1945863 RepID=UPI0009854681|nr:hypothetical protein [Algoriphagus sp. A40]OOG70783.1 hypothetical protein B0E43_19385 [Algoriphagus sp. A40]
MKVYALLGVFLFFGCSIASAQDTTATQNSLRSGTITSQFEYIYRVSNNIREHEVVKKSHLEQLKANVLDSIRTRTKEITQLQTQIGSLNDSMTLVKQLLSTEVEQKNQAIASGDNFTFFGITIQKTVYSSLMWILVVVLAGALGFFAMQYFRSFGRIKKAEKDFLEVQEEFEQHRKNTLDRERKLKRELINAQMGKN